MSFYTKIFIIANLFSIITIAVVAISIIKKQRIDKAEHRVSLFKEAVTKSAQELSAGQEKNLTCPLCGHTAVIGKSPYNGYVYAQCDCGVGFIIKKTLISKE